MARSSTNWNVGLAQDLRDPAFAREFLRASIEEGIPVRVVTNKIAGKLDGKARASKDRPQSRTGRVTIRRNKG